MLGNKKFSPERISGLRLWLDGDDLSSFTKNISDKVSQWNDKSGFGHHATQGIETKQPTWMAAQHNLKPTVYFDNTDTMLIEGAAIFSVTNGPNTSFIVSKATAASGVTDYLWYFSESGGGRNYLSYLPAEGNLRFQSRSANSNGVLYTGAVNDVYQIIRARREGVIQAIAVNGGDETTNSFGGDEDGTDALYLGSRANIDSFLDGYIAELIMYNRSLSPTEINRVERYLKNKWAIL